MTDFPSTPDQVRTDRDATREEITETVDALVHKAAARGKALLAVLALLIVLRLLLNMRRRHKS